MKKILMLALLASFALYIDAKDIKTLKVTTTPQMHCTGCETKIRENIRFEKGVKRIETDIESQTVTITYDADKNTEENIIKSFGKFGYEAKRKTDKE